MISIKNISHSFKIGKKGTEETVPVLKDVSMDIPKGEITCIVGKSGSGKSTLLNLISGYIAPTEGTIEINNQTVTNFNEKEWAQFRLEHFGFIFQNFQLIPSLTTYENIELPLTLKGMRKSHRKQKVLEILQTVGLENHRNHYPNELSGGQQQRVSIARALVLNPSIILADEPTGSLDSETERVILSFIQTLNKQYGITFVMITHDEEVSSIAHHKLHLHDGVLRKEGVKNEF
ncbi:ABC transporter ATP-binding protein [Priestia filamentosa]|uniref:ABC transporter ATP-binding protein n=1 Tax=Priestia filamentosa TaxID=1402861 RepID=A0A1X7CP24_9BACI|nr:ABC transporter ATP-binding protein [Priestia filamentosa]AKO94486.1 ABC transporter ATP-binding protein [Priestia filamentosa]MDT3764781.1 ABC transporter ATP-binding protein [Priestia filamentosa]OXS70776.1 ABC transporter ATP-binding protein [Priestia filamentosa]RJS66408.1 ABC transporter ATP-binding protein [Priestia filamentosa]WCM15383.1 ABC transporter ATP-binding protein [Priestia filamentosa]